MAQLIPLAAGTPTAVIDDGGCDVSLSEFPTSKEKLAIVASPRSAINNAFDGPKELNLTSNLLTLMRAKVDIMASAVDTVDEETMSSAVDAIEASLKSANTSAAFWKSDHVSCSSPGRELII